MTDFKTGDKVRYISRETQFYGVEGIVSSIWESYVEVTITEKPSTCDYEDDTFLPWTTNLELVKPEFTFKDIQPGDHIRRTINREDGSKVIWEGVAHRKNYDGSKWVTSRDYHIAYKGDDLYDEHTLELIERPKPKHWAFTKPVGSIVVKRIKDVPEYLSVYTKTGEDKWQGYLAANNSIFEKTVESLAHDLRSLEEDSDLLEWLK